MCQITTPVHSNTQDLKVVYSEFEISLCYNYTVFLKKEGTKTAKYCRFFLGFVRDTPVYIFIVHGTTFYVLMSKFNDNVRIYDWILYLLLLQTPQITLYIKAY